jgi:outer membrane murein-binding lipoprotein Lpp
MTDLAKLILASAVAGAFALGGCGNESGTTEAAPDVGDETQSPNDHEGHDHDEGEHDAHAAERELGEVIISGTTFRVRMGGELEPTATLHLDIQVVEGPEPAAIRVWIGDESAVGSLKGKASGGGEGAYHADAEAPAELSPDAALWIEVESVDGERSVGSVALGA